MKIFIKGLNACAMRAQKLKQYRKFLLANNHTLVDSPAEGDIILVWTCAFRTDHRDGSIEKIRYYLSNYTAKIVVTGCLPDIAAELLDFNSSRVSVANWKEDIKKLNEIFEVKNSLESFWDVFIEERLCEDATKYRLRNPEKDATFHDQFIKLLVSEGCNFKCSYCSERLAFPQYRSFPPQLLYAACEEVVNKSEVYEVILLADSLGQYGSDIDTDLPFLLKNLKKIHPDIKFALNNLHLSSFINFLDDMKYFIENNYLSHLNLPIQSGSDRILNNMNRIYAKRDIENAFGLLNDIGFNSFDTHIIVGFPGESEDDFEETLELLVKYRPRYVLASKYMESRNAPSAALPNKVDDGTASKRILKAEELFRQNDIICNCDHSKLSKDRLKRIHLD